MFKRQSASRRISDSPLSEFLSGFGLAWPLSLLVGARTNYVFATITGAFTILFILGVAIACLVVGSTTGRYVGAVLLLAWLFVAYRMTRRHFVWRAGRRA
jgi:hypothetical protein